MRIGVFGGAFDPVHWAHLGVAERCRDRAHLDEVWFLPSAHHPFKPDRQVSPFEHRVAMLRLAISDRPGISVCEIERDLPSPTYTANVLDALAERQPTNEWFFILGGDAVVELPLWHDPPRILARATLIATARPGHAVPSTEQLRKNLALSAETPVRLQVVDLPPSDLSSRDIRRRVREGLSISGMVPPEVEKYILENGLYRSS